MGSDLPNGAAKLTKQFGRMRKYSPSKVNSLHMSIPQRQKEGSEDREGDGSHVSIFSHTGDIIHPLSQEPTMAMPSFHFIVIKNLTILHAKNAGFLSKALGKNLDMERVYCLAIFTND